jgi:RHS repeat-associated protein
MYNESYITAGGTLITLPDKSKQFNAMDNIGSVRLTVTVKDAAISYQSFDYKPFGDTLNAGGESRIGYAAQERDEESRYFAMGARQYDPLSGRFLSVDPLYESFPDKTPYHYCNNNPISFKDPSGLSPEEEKKSVDQIQTLVWKDISEEMEATETGGLFEDNRQFVETMNWASGGLTSEEYLKQMNPSFYNMRYFGGSSGGGISRGYFYTVSTDNTGGRTITKAINGLVVTGSGSAISKFKNVVYKGTGGHYSADVDNNGQVTLEKNDDGIMTESQQAFYDVMAEATDMSKSGVTIRLVEWGDKSELDQQTLIGNYKLGSIDIDDVQAIGNGKESFLTSVSALGHEIAEQTFSQRSVKRGNIYNEAHLRGCIAESRISGCIRGIGDADYTNNKFTGYIFSRYIRNTVVWGLMVMFYKGNLIGSLPVPIFKTFKKR